MNAQQTSPAPTLDLLFQALLPYLPQQLQQGLTAALPDLRIHLARLALEILDAERNGGPGYSKAVQRPDFPLMARVYHGAADLLRWKLPADIRNALKPLLQLAADGAFDPTRHLLFAMAWERDNPEAALGRFFLWCAILLNLRIYTWDTPEVEAFGILQEIEEQAQRRLEELLDDSEMHASKVRLLHVLVAGMLEHARLIHNATWRVAVAEFGSGIDELMKDTAALRILRSMDSRSAATLEPLLHDPSIGSQQIVERYPQHFQTIDALESLRARVCHKLSTGQFAPTENRVIDLLRRSSGEST